jgi:hypothetical protein
MRSFRKKTQHFVVVACSILFFPFKKKKLNFSNSILDLLDDIYNTQTFKMTSFDAVFRRLILSQSFIRGWGNPLHLQELCTSRREKVAVRNECLKLVPADSIQENTIEIVKQETKGDRQYINAKFRSPLAIHLPHLVSKFISYLVDQ